MAGERGVRRAAARLVDRALASSAPVEPALAAAAAGLEARDRALLAELVLGTLRWLRRLDHLAAAAAAVERRRIDRRLRTPLRLGAYQLVFLDRVPAYAAVDEAVAEARRRAGRGGAGFVNHALRRLAERPELDAWPVATDDPVARLGIETSHPDWLVRRWLERFGERPARELLRASNLPRRTHLLAFGDRGGRRALAARLASEGVATEPARWAPEGLVVTAGDPLASGAFAAGDFYIQDQASQAAALVPAPVAGERVLDAAAAPGGKGFALVAAEPSLEVISADRSPARLARLRQNLERLGRRVPLVAGDASRPPFGAVFDRVVCDLPCSGTGTLRQHPELKWRLSERELGRLAALQRRIVEGALAAVRPGGLLTSITCSLEPEENEDLVAGLVRDHPELEPLELAGRLPAELEPAIAGSGCWRLPTGADNDGFTVHALRRRSGAQRC